MSNNNKLLKRGDKVRVIDECGHYIALNAIATVINNQPHYTSSVFIIGPWRTNNKTKIYQTVHAYQLERYRHTSPTPIRDHVHA